MINFFFFGGELIIFMCEKEWDGFLRLFYYYYHRFCAFVPKCEFSTICFFQGETNYGDFFLFM